jgi:serine/threonine protein kinase
LKLSSFATFRFGRYTVLRDFEGEAESDFTAPEVESGDDYKQPADIWALGVLLFHLLTFEYFFEVNRILELKEAIKLREHTTIYKGKFLKTYRTILDGMLKINPAERMNINQVLAEPCIRENVWDWITSPMFQEQYIESHR